MGYFYKKKFKIFFIYIVNLQILELFVRSLLKIVYLHAMTFLHICICCKSLCMHLSNCHFYVLKLRYSIFNNLINRIYFQN